MILPLAYGTRQAIALPMVAKMVIPTLWTGRLTIAVYSFWLRLWTKPKLVTERSLRLLED